MSGKLNSRYVAYAKAHGKTPGRMLAHDRKRFPGGPMAGYITWLEGRWREWETLTGRAKPLAADPTERVEAKTTPEGREGWEQPRHPELMGEGGHDQDGGTDAIPGGVRADTRHREQDGDRGDPGSAPPAFPAARPAQRSGDRT